MSALAGRPAFLALDTATELCSAALLAGERLLVAEEEIGRGHAERILPMIDALLREGGLALRDLDAIAFGRGPGGFTGVRLATSIAQGLAFGAARPLLPVSDLEALARRAFDLEPRATHALACSDARMREVYWALYARDAREPLGAERVGAPDSVDLAGLDPAVEAGAFVVGVGRGFRAYPALAERLGARLGAIEAGLLPRAAEIARLAARDWRAGRAVPAAEGFPVYLRDDVAKPAR